MNPLQLRYKEGGGICPSGINNKNLYYVSIPNLTRFLGFSAFHKKLKHFDLDMFIDSILHWFNITFSLVQYYLVQYYFFFRFSITFYGAMA